MSNEPIVHFEAASTLAVVVSSNEPLLFLSKDQKVIAASTSFCRTFEIDPATIPGRPLGSLGNGEWAMPKLASLLPVNRRPILALPQIWWNSLMSSRSGGLEEDQAFRDRRCGVLRA